MTRQLLFTAAILLWLVSATAQITNYSVVSEKIYPDNTRICYFEISEILSQKEKMFLQSKVTGSESILRLHFFDYDEQLLMFESFAEWDVDSVVHFLNGLLNRKEEIEGFSYELNDIFNIVPNRADDCPPLDQPYPNGCPYAEPFCTDLGEYCFPASVGKGSIGRIGCLSTTPNPAWYWMQIDQPGNMQIKIEQKTPKGVPVDVDFSAWGPFTAVEHACSNYSNANQVDCSYSSSNIEYFDLHNVKTGQIYLLLLTNYDDEIANIRFGKVAGSGTATTNCSIVTPPTDNNGPLCLGDTLKLTAQTSNVEGAKYRWTGPNEFFRENEQNPIIPNVTTENAGTYTLVITANDQEGDPKTTDVVVNVPTEATISETICFNDSLVFLDATYYKSGTYYDTIPNAAGCDSVITLNLIVLPVDTLHLSAGICKGESYLFFDKELTNSGIYDTIVPSMAGCDTIVQLVLTVHLLDTTHIQESICEGESYNFYGTHLKTAGTYDTTLHNMHGCDSTLFLTLTVNSIYSADLIMDTICEGESYIFGEDTLTVAGLYSRNPGTVNGCDSIVRLLLTKIPTEFSIISPPDVICADAHSFCVPVDLHGSTMSYYDVRFDPNAQEQKFENFNVAITDRNCLEIKIPNNPNDRQDYVMPNNYTVYISVNDGKCSSDTLQSPFQILYPSWIFEQKWNDVMAILNNQYNGGYLFSNYEWFKNGSPMGVTGSYIQTPLDFTPGTEYSVRLTRMGETTAFFTCPLVPEYRSSNKVYPQLVAKNERVNVETQQDGIVTVWNILGIKLAQYPVFANQINKIPLNVTGFFILEVIQNNGNRQTFKVIVN